MKKYYLLLVLTIAIVIFAFNFNDKVAADIPKIIESNLDNFFILLEEKVEKDPKIGLSSNPYDYIKEDKNFDNIIAIGIKAVPVLRNMIEISEYNGLREYIMAIAIERILKIDLKADEQSWDTAKSFIKVSGVHFKSIPSKVDQIVSSSVPTADKNNELVKLGTPAVPYIINKLEEGNQELIPAVEILLGDEYGFEKGVNKVDYLIQHKNDFSEYDLSN